ncbi:PiggyBac transposable element-derived protein 4 [Plakobranchus ocellatus]|uniref:PiggyBac transposable element-derived protein 4 n=1 Tax=Plakobranchus ocellatus TaxID=259542 RepID=A0AAV3ZNR8_9GAST|nr:PiggyBac transposable element-derived protein 4 [Plakobranchus ocellatus]
MAPNAQTTSANIVNFPRNSIPNTQNATSPAETFDLFISQDMIKVIVKCTNEEGKRQRGDAWKATDDVEIRGLIRFLVLLGAQKQANYQEHKNKNVILLSTMRTQPVILPGEKKKPEIVMYYNSTKGGRCGLCHWKVNKKGTVKCHKYCNFLCKDHVAKSGAYWENCDT